MRKLWTYLKDDSGQTSTEYILLLAVAAAIVFKFREIALKKLTPLINAVFDKAGEGINSPIP